MEWKAFLENTTFPVGIEDWDKTLSIIYSLPWVMGEKMTMLKIEWQSALWPGSNVCPRQIDPEMLL